MVSILVTTHQVHQIAIVTQIKAVQIKNFIAWIIHGDIFIVFLPMEEFFQLVSSWCCEVIISLKVKKI